jgi:beta-glucosidase
VTVTNPGSQAGTVGTAISTLDIAASSSKGDHIASYGATGLPAGLSVDTATGAITGTPGTAGTYTVTISATDNGGTKGTASFTWTISFPVQPVQPGPPPTGPAVTYSGTIRLYKMGLCLDDRHNSSVPGAVVQVWRCNGLPNQDWQVMSDGTIQHNGLCLDAKANGTANGTRIDLWTCTGAPNQQWDTTGWRVHYDNPAATDKVLDDTAFGGSGTALELYTDNGGRNQSWETY